MYASDDFYLPKAITRDIFVDRVFDIGTENEHGLNTIIAAVNIADNFVKYRGKWKICDWINPSEDEQALITTLPVARIYSEELAHVVSILSSKIYEDDGYWPIYWSVININNKYIYKLEWEICFMFNFYFPMQPNFITVLYNLINDNSAPLPELSRKFWYLAKDICLDPGLLNINPVTTVVGIILLQRKNKLLADTKYRAWKFINLIATIQLYTEYDEKYIIKTILKK